jgi:hypothetical protein
MNLYRELQLPKLQVNRLEGYVVPLNPQVRKESNYQSLSFPHLFIFEVFLLLNIFLFISLS